MTPTEICYSVQLVPSPNDALMHNDGKTRGIIKYDMHLAYLTTHRCHAEFVS